MQLKESRPISKPNKAAQALGRLGKGKKKTLTNAERKRRAARLAQARALRWEDPANA